MYEKFKDFQLSILGLCLALGVVLAALIVTDNLSKDNISVTGSAYEIVKSDSASWTCTISAKSSSKLEAYKMIKKQLPVVKKYMIDKGFDENLIEVQLPTTYETYRTNANGYSTNDIAYYNYSQPIKITSKDVEKIRELSTDYQVLVEKGINISSYSAPEYQYSKLGELKVKLLEDATKDAKNRAKSMLKSNRNRVGKIRSARMGVFQITPVDSTSVSDMGINDLSTIEKKVTAVANVVFAIK